LSIDLIFSDIHGDIEALNTILDISTSKEFQKKFGNIKRVINLGDILGRGTHPVQVINKLKLLQKMYDFISVIGNHDESFLYKKTIAVYPKESVEAHSSLTKKDLEIFQKNSDIRDMKKSFLALVLAFTLSLFWSQNAYAYLDPGSASIVLQAVVGALIGVGITVKIYWYKIKEKLSRFKSKERTH